MAERDIDGELTIPINWLRVLSRSLYSFGVMAILAVGVVSYAVRRGADAAVAVAISTALGLVWVLGAWLIARDDLRTICARRLRLDSRGFTFGRHRWVWADIERLYVSREDDGEGGQILRIAVVYLPGSTSTAPKHTAINPLDFKTGDGQLVDILDQWRQRYGTPMALGKEPPAPAD
jgi:hypothetical protein